MTPESYEKIASVLFHGSIFFGAVLFFLALFNLPIILFFAAWRRRRIQDSNFDAATGFPLHAALSYGCSLFYGLILPAAFFLFMRGHRAFGPWKLAHPVTPVWATLPCALGMIWLATRLLEGAFNRDCPRFGGKLDRLIAGIGVLICAIYQGLLFPKIDEDISERVIVFGFYYVPLTSALGAMMVYYEALSEAFRNPAPPRRRRRLAFSISVVGVCLVFLPLWLTVPRVTHRQALRIVESHRDLIESAARDAEIDPKLLAGVIYALNTRDHPRWTGEFIEKISLALRNSITDEDLAGLIRPDPAIGLFPLKYDRQCELLNTFEHANSIINTKYYPRIYMLGYYPEWPETEHDVPLDEQLPPKLIQRIRSNKPFQSIVKEYQNQYDRHIEALRNYAREYDRVSTHSLEYDSEAEFDLRLSDSGVLRAAYSIPELRDLREAFGARLVVGEDDKMEYELNDSRALEDEMYEGETNDHDLFYIEGGMIRGLVIDDEFSVLLGAAMLGIYDRHVRVNSPKDDRIEAIMRLCPYHHPSDLARRVKAIMNSKDFDRIFGPAAAVKKEARK